LEKVVNMYPKTTTQQWTSTRFSICCGIIMKMRWWSSRRRKNNFDFDDLGKYFSALSNEANLNKDSIRDYHEMVLGNLE